MTNFRDQITGAATNDDWGQAQAIINQMVAQTGNSSYNWKLEESISTHNWVRFQELCGQLINEEGLPDEAYRQEMAEAGRLQAEHKNHPEIYGQVGKKIG